MGVRLRQGVLVAAELEPVVAALRSELASTAGLAGADLVVGGTRFHRAPAAAR